MEKNTLTKDELVECCKYCLELTGNKCSDKCPAREVTNCNKLLRESVRKVIAEQDKTIADQAERIAQMETAYKKNFDTITLLKEIIATQENTIKELKVIELDRKASKKTDRDKAYLAGKVDALEYALVATLEKAVPKGYKF